MFDLIIRINVGQVPLFKINWMFLYRVTFRLFRVNFRFFAT